MVQADAAWERYARAVIAAMTEVLGEAHDEAQEMIVETADYWLSLGLAIGLRRSAEGEQLLALILAQEGEQRAELDLDAEEFCREALP